MNALSHIGLTPERVRQFLKTTTPTQSPAPSGRGGPRGELFRAKIPASTIHAIRTERDGGHKVVDIAVRHGVSAAYVSLVTYGLRRRSEGVAQ